MTDERSINGAVIEIGDEELVALTDGQLDRDPRYKAMIERMAAADPELARRAQVFREHTECLRRTYAVRLAEPVPARLLDALERDGTAASGRRALRAAAIVAVALGAGTLGWFGAKLDADGGVTSSPAPVAGPAPETAPPAVPRTVASEPPVPLFPGVIAPRTAEPEPIRGERLLPLPARPQPARTQPVADTAGTDTRFEP